MLQDKIDKIGGFRFTIKGWSVTAVIAGTITTSGKGLAIAYPISLGLLVMLFFFLLLEYEQVRQSWVYGDRSARLEDLFQRIAHGKGEELFHSVPVPFTVHDLVRAGFKKKSGRRDPKSPAIVRTRPGFWRKVGLLHLLFYLVLMFLSLNPLVAQYKEVAKKLASFHEKTNGAAKPTPSAQPTVPKPGPIGNKT
jgi:hypothetical protein